MKENIKQLSIRTGLPEEMLTKFIEKWLENRDELLLTATELHYTLRLYDFKVFQVIGIIKELGMIEETEQIRTVYKIGGDSMR